MNGLVRPVSCLEPRRLRVTVSLLIGLAWASSLTAQEVRLWPDPGYRRLGVYGGGPSTHFDYPLQKITLGETFPEKRAFWERLREQRAQTPDAGREEVYLVSCGERTDDFATIRARLEAWLAPEPGVPTDPALIPAICLGEENTGDRRETLDRVARFIRETYGIPVFQWLTDPAPPDPELTADGWIWDSYGWDEQAFRRHAMKFVALGKPAICVPWATDPHWPQWTQYPTAQALINREWHQFRTCAEFNLSCAVFAVAGPGAINPWLGSPTDDMVLLRNWLRTRRDEMRDLLPGDLPLRSADFSARERNIPVGGDADAPSLYEEDFSGFRWIHDADLRGFRHLQLTSRPEIPGLLRVKTAPGRPQQATLTWRFESYFPLERVRVVLDAAAPEAGACRNELAFSTDETQEVWGPAVVQAGTKGVESLVLTDDGTLRGRHWFLLRISLSNFGDHAYALANQLDRLRVECVHQPPPAGAVAELVADDYGRLRYTDDFSTRRWQHLGELRAEHPSHGGYRGGQFWVGLLGGSATSIELRQRVRSPRPLQHLTVTARGMADGANLGGGLVLEIIPRDAGKRWRVASTGLHQGDLQLTVPTEELHGLQEFEVVLHLLSGSGVEGGAKACAELHALRIDGR